MLVPAFVMAEATLSFVGLGFAEPTPSWGVMLADAWQGAASRTPPGSWPPRSPSLTVFVDPRC